MSKYKRFVVGSVCKAKDAGKPDYIKMGADINLKKGDILNLESAKAQLESLEASMANGKLSAELGAKIKERLEKIPSFVRFQIVKISKED